MTDRLTQQLELFSETRTRTPEELAAALAGASPKPLRLALTRNRFSTVSIRSSPDSVRLRLDRTFLRAPEPVIAALRECMERRSKAAWETVRTFACAITPEPPETSRPRLCARGEIYDLLAVRDRVNRRYFNGRLKCRIGWGRAGTPRRARTRSLRFGSYWRSEDVIRIHPALDDKRVPPEFVEYIVFHEMLHAAVPSDKAAGRWIHHHRTFRSLESRFPDVGEMRRLSGELIRTLASRGGNAKCEWKARRS